MSTAYYPQGMRSMPASGYNHNSTYYLKKYLPWKGSGTLSNPTGIAPTHIRPLTNNDSGNVFQSGSFPSRTYSNTRVFIPRPIKHFRKGRVIPNTPITVTVPDPNNPNQYNEVALINYNMNRVVKSSTGASLGGGFGGSGLLNDLMDKPGCVIIKQNPLNEISESEQLNNDCTTCEGIGIVSSYYPNNTYVTENPVPQTVNSVWCCNPEQKAKQRVMYANTNLSKTYYTTTKQYLQNRCKTYEQKAFNFQNPVPVQITNAFLQSGVTTSEINNSKPGAPLSTFNTYVGNCFPNAQVYDATENALTIKLLNILLTNGILNPQQILDYQSMDNANNFDTLFDYLKSLPDPVNTEAINRFNEFISNPYWGVPYAGPSNPNGCKLTVYKPNNYQYAKQGAVSSSTRMLKLNVDTISTNSASITNYNNTGSQLVSANQLYQGDNNNVMNLLKNKANTNCQNPPIMPYPNKKVCRLNNYYNSQPKSQPSPYRYYIGTVFSGNSFSKSTDTTNASNEINETDNGSTTVTHLPIIIDE
uniref:Uncharacterized protein n=1 Tax=viral metagenome TaxID=1070528 RepID=A0A6C0ES25_9ZZZZ